MGFQRSILRPNISSFNGLASGLLADWYPTSGVPLTSQGLATPMTMNFVGSPTYANGLEGIGLSCVANDSGAYLYAPASMQLQIGTLFIRMQHLGAPTVNANIGGCTYTNSDTAPYIGYSIGANSTYSVVGWSNATSSVEQSGAISFSTGVVYTYAVTFGTYDYVTLYQIGVVSTNTNIYGAIKYTNTSSLFLGCPGYALSRTSNMLAYGMRVYNRYFGAAEILAMHNNWYNIYQKSASRVFFQSPIGYTSAGSGDWATPSTWTANKGYPGSRGVNGDSWTIKDGHAVTLSKNVITAGGTIGDGSGNNSTFASLALNANASLTINVGDSGQTNMYHYGDLTLGSGAQVLHTGTGSGYARWHWYSTKSLRGCNFVINGTSGSRAAFKGLATYAGFYIDQSGSFNSINWNYCDFQYNGSTGPLLTFTGGEGSVAVTNCTYDHCYEPVYYSGYLSATTNIAWTNCKWSNTSGASGNYDFSVRCNALTTGSRIITGCAFDGGLNTNGGGFSGFQTSNCTFNYGNSPGVAATGFTNQGSSGAWTSCSYNFIRQTNVATDFWQMGPMDHNILFCDHASGTDPNMVQVNGTYSPSTISFTNNIFQSNCGDNNGALHYAATTLTASMTVTSTNNLVLPNLNASKPGSSGSIANSSNISNVTWTVDHNTVCVDTGSTFKGAIYYADQGGNPGSGIYTSVRSNIAYSLSSASTNNALISANSSAGHNDVCTPANVGYNCIQNGTASSASANTSKRGYISASSYLFSTTPLADTTDYDGNPQFVDTTRNLATYYTNGLGYTTTGTAAGDAQALALLFANDATHAVWADSTAIQKCWNWITAGWAPTNAATNTTYSGDTNPVQNMGAFSGLYYKFQTSTINAGGSMGFAHGFSISTGGNV